MLNDNYKKKSPRSSLPSSHKQIYNCYKFFREKIGSEIKEPQNLARFLDKVISQKLFFTRIVVADEANAYLIFETLNARGIELAPNDLIKNYLFSLLEKEKVPKSDIERLLGDWDDIMQELGPREFVRFLRGYLNSQVSPVVRRERLFWHIKREVQDRNTAKQLIEDIRRKEILYLTLRNPDDQFWNGWPDQQSIKFYLTLLNLFNVRQHYPLVFAMYDAVLQNKFDRVEFVRLLKHITVIVFRYNIIGRRNPNQMEAIYNEIAVKIRKGAIETWKSVWRHLSDLYVRDNEFIQAFTNAEFKGKRNTKLAKYILLSIEFYTRRPDAFRFDDPQIIALVNDSRVTIEHVLPRTADSASWGKAFESHLHNILLWRLGNLTLLEDTLNRSIGNKSFEEKRKVYSRSDYIITRKIVEKDKWLPDSISERQEVLAQIAAKVWRVTLTTTQTKMAKSPHSK